MTDLPSGKKLIIFDYNGVIVPEESRAFGKILRSFFGEEKYEAIKKLEGPEKTAFHRYIARDDLTQTQALELWHNFTSNNRYYRELLERAETEPILMRKMHEIRVNSEQIPETNVAGFVINKILLPLIAYYSVFINNHRPAPEFKDLCERLKENILVINTNALEGLICEEIGLLSQIEGFEYLRCFSAESSLIFGGTAISSKEDPNRMKFILDEVHKKFPNLEETIFVGDGFRDCANFVELTELRLVPQSRLFFIQTIQDSEEQPQCIEDLVQNLRDRVSRSRDNKSKFDKYTKQLRLLESVMLTHGRDVIPIAHIRDCVGRF